MREALLNTENKMKKNILIVGAGGVLGSNLINFIAEQEYQIYAVDLKKDFMISRIKSSKNILFFDISELMNGRIPLSTIDIIVQCAFSRSQEGYALIESINLTETIFKLAQAHKVPKVIHISSQSLYGKYREDYSKENDKLNPFDMYGIAKFACEKISSYISCATTQITNIRLASLIGPQFPERVVSRMLEDAKEYSQIKIIGGKQVFSFLDIRDAVSGIACLLKNSDKKWKEIYNLGTQNSYTIIEIAQIISKYFKEKKNKDISISIEEKDIKQQILLDSESFEQDFKWKPRYNLIDSIAEIYNAGK